MSFLARIIVSTLLVTHGLLVAGCDESTAVGNGRVFGPDAQIGNGTARTFIELESGKPVEMGIELTEAAFQGLPTAGDHSHHELVLGLPGQNPTPIQHVVLNWNAGGHEPPGIYDLPHFDFHFYLTSNADRMAIVPTDPEYQAKAAKYPAAQFIPAGYIAPAPDAVPAMGVHWIDPASPEFNGVTFTRTFLYGSWNGALTFLEPMITKAYLESRPNASFSIGTAARYATPGYYPSNYQIRFNAATGRHEIVLGDLTWRD